MCFKLISSIVSALGVLWWGRLAVGPMLSDLIDPGADGGQLALCLSAIGFSVAYPLV